MSTEQPSQRPEFEGAVITNWIRTQAIEFGLDANKLIRGQVLDAILGDDVNTFVSLPGLLEMDMVEEFNNLANAGRDALADSLEWESSVPEIDPSLRERLARVRDQVRSSDWTNQQSFRDTTKLWREEIFDWVNRQAKDDPGISEAASYFKDTWFADTPFKKTYLQSRKN